ncbi:hypothetical protein [Curtobacterium sp. MCBA15_008]|uniref:hypothetical protein n=1 Tax=Curtobacterium sp. MCBA15_008 TaxID=1898736 RepID=UPI0008DDE82C|nr:hypothetical protein [Curtobacterium sp. MCBA15_008]OII13933.1 hypothetical protein BIU96_12405 [Curtobacterium sp. MCBA15_008]
MTEMKRRSVLERLVGKPLPWIAWTWAALAVIWIILAIVDPSGFHTFMAITWSILAALQLSANHYARKQERSRAPGADFDTAAR